MATYHISDPKVRDPMAQEVATFHRSMDINRMRDPMAHNVLYTHGEMVGNASKYGCKVSAVELEGAFW
jgi:hypothetical protein